MKIIGDETTISPRKQKAYKLADVTFQGMLQVAMQEELKPGDMIEPMLQRVAQMVAAATVTGDKQDVEDLLNKFRAEVSLSTQTIMARTQ